jgi:hypothetical protein
MYCFICLNILMKIEVSSVNLFTVCVSLYSLHVWLGYMEKTLKSMYSEQILLLQVRKVI